jgi:hypothetical protein
VARRYTWQFGQLVDHPFNPGGFLLPAGDRVVSSVEDMARYALAHLGASSVGTLSPTSLVEQDTGGAPTPGSDYL